MGSLDTPVFPVVLCRGGKRGTGGGRREGGIRDFKGGGNREDISLYLTIEIGQRGGNHERKGAGTCNLIKRHKIYSRL